MPKPKKIINDPDDAVEEFIQGLLLQYPNRLVKIANHHVVLAAHREESKVQLLSGGGSGHEPSHAGWIGQGMLTGAICGGIFASPSVASVLAGIRAVSGDVLLVVKNYTGDRLNFGMAAEQANQQGQKVALVVVADDCALPRTKGITGARGVAGTVLVHKVAGAAAASGKSLEQVVDVAKLVAGRMGTLGIALDSVTLPGAEQTNDRLDEKTIEIGLGIHGEAGLKQSPLLTANEMAREMVTTILNYGLVEMDEKGHATILPMFQAGDELCVLVNNLGGTSNFEMAVLARACVSLLESDEFATKVTRLFVGTFMTSFDMHGASLTILNVTGQDEIVALLDAPTNAPAWSSCDVWTSNRPRPSSVEVPEVVVDESAMEMSKPSLVIDDFASSAASMIKDAADKLVESEPMLTQYDVVVGDGDCGTTMKRGAVETLARLENGTIPTDHPVPMFAALADCVSASMGGTSGVLLELMFRKIGSTLSRENQIGVEELCTAFKAGVDALSLYGGAQAGSRTMLEALVPAMSTLLETKDLREAARAAREGADSTAQMEAASAGRSNYLSEDTLLGTPDPGAIAMAILLESLASGKVVYYR